MLPAYQSHLEQDYIRIDRYSIVRHDYPLQIIHRFIFSCSTFTLYDCGSFNTWLCVLCFGASALLLMKSKQQHSSSGCMPLSMFIAVVTVKMVSLLFVLLSRLLLLVLVFYCPVLLLVIVLPFGSSVVSSCSAVVSRFWCCCSFDFIICWYCSYCHACQNHTKTCSSVSQGVEQWWLMMDQESSWVLYSCSCMVHYITLIPSQ